MKPLVPGRHGYLDSGVRLDRSLANPTIFKLDLGDHGQRNLSRKDIKQMAKLAGFSVEEKEN